MMIKNDRLIWLDLEMTGLDPRHDRIIEIATIVTDAALNIIAEGPVFAIHQSDKILEAMDAWNTSHHTQSGLVERIRKSKIRPKQAEAETLAFLQQYVGPKESPLCGNTIYHDRKFMARLMPQLEAFFHYRNIDVSTIKELVKRWFPEVTKGLNKRPQHTALADIRDSIAELAYYRQYVFKG